MNEAALGRIWGAVFEMQRAGRVSDEVPNVAVSGDPSYQNAPSSQTPHRGTTCGRPSASVSVVQISINPGSETVTVVRA